MINRGFTADATTTHFIDSTFHCPDAPTLEALLSDTENGDIDGLMGLILSPDQIHFLEMEDLLENGGGDTIDINAVLSLLPDRFQSALHFSNQRPAVRFPVSKAVVDRFLSLFYLSETIAPDFRDSLKRRLPEKNRRLKTMVAIRQARVIVSGRPRSGLNHLVQYIEAAAHLPDTDFFSCLKTLLEIFRHPTAKDDLPATLTAEKTRCCRQLEQSRHSEKQLAAKNIETLMMQGMRGMLMVDHQAVQEKIDTLDMLGRLLFGRPLATASEIPLAFSFEKDTGR